MKKIHNRCFNLIIIYYYFKIHIDFFVFLINKVLYLPLKLLLSFITLKARSFKIHLQSSAKTKLSV